MADDKNWFDGRRLKKEGIDLVGQNNHDWMVAALIIVATHAPIDREFMAEEFRGYPNIGEPGHSNAWGALTNLLIKRKVIEPTGKYAQATGRSNHAHTYKIYRRTRSRAGSEIPLKVVPWTEP